VIPKFAVVGHPNKGKSSIVATLAQDDSVFIDRVSGSTTKTHIYPMTVDGAVLYELIDTPGFQRARAALTWLTQHCPDVSQRAKTVAQFCLAQADNTIFYNECQLLQPLIEGAGIIYVVDGSRPYGPEYEAEMEILRWTGRPSLAIINPIDSEEFVQAWESALVQYFKTVRVFNAHRAEFVKRTSLLKVFGQLQPEWEQPIANAIEALKKERDRQHRQASALIAAFLVESLQHKETLRCPGEQIPPGTQALLSTKYEHALRRLEKQCRRQVEETYTYYQLRRQETDLSVESADLFNQESWYLFGLNKLQLVSVAAGAGVSAGLLVDAGLGGHSMLIGSAIGGISGAMGAWILSKQIAKFAIKGLPTGGSIITYGPARHPNFPFVLLGRALHHLELICTRTHARRDTLSVDSDPPLSQFNIKDKTHLMTLFKNISNNKKTFEQREKVAETVYQFAKQLDGEV